MAIIEKHKTKRKKLGLTIGTTQSSTEPFPFLRLPSEIRNLIYSYLLHEEKSIEAFDIFRNTTRWPVTIPLLNSSLAIRRDAFQTWLQVNNIQLSKRFAHLVNYFDTFTFKQNLNVDVLSSIHHAVVVVGDQSLLSDVGELHSVGNLLMSAIRLRSLEFHVLRDYPPRDEGIDEATWYCSMVIELLCSATKLRTVVVKPVLRFWRPNLIPTALDSWVESNGTIEDYITLHTNRSIHHAKEFHRTLQSISAKRPEISFTLQSPTKVDMVENTIIHPGGYADSAVRDFRDLLMEHNEDV
jgi:hypothetical protein